MQEDDKSNICKKDDTKYHINFDQFGVSVKTNGEVIANGIKVNTYDWNVGYGDILGIGLTKHDSSRRVWITKNGVIMNPPSQEEMAKMIKFDKDKGETEAITKKNKAEVDE